MTNEKLKSLIRETLEPVLDSLTNKVYEFYEKVVPNVPAGMSDEQLKEFLEPMFKHQTDTLTTAFNTVDVNEIAKQVKEKQNGR